MSTATRQDIPQIEVSEIVKQFGDVKALDGLSFEVRTGEVLGLLGPNGSGKTTIINVLSTLMKPDSGSATVAGFDVGSDSEAVRSSIALTGQFAAVDDVLTGHENLVLFARLRGLSKAKAILRAVELLEQFSLTDSGSKQVGTYSGGMRRRLDLAASLVVPAPVIFLDEPTTGLDPRSRNELWDVVRELRSQGVTIVLTTQYLEEADVLADRIVVIDRGRVVAEGTPVQLKQRAGAASCVVTPSEVDQLELVASTIADLGELSIDVEQGTVVLANGGAQSLATILKRLAEAGIELSEATLRRPTLDEVFLQLTDHSSDSSSASVEGAADQLNANKSSDQ